MLVLSRRAVNQARRPVRRHPHRGAVVVAREEEKPQHGLGAVNCCMKRSHFNRTLASFSSLVARRWSRLRYCIIDHVRVTAPKGASLVCTALLHSCDLNGVKWVAASPWAAESVVLPVVFLWGGFNNHKRCDRRGDWGALQQIRLLGHNVLLKWFYSVFSNGIAMRCNSCCSKV